jgi:hypothetical protein
MDLARLLIGGASRPRPGELANGDAWTVNWRGPICRLVLVDGLGHGPEAAYAAEQACALYDELPDIDAASLFAACHQRLRGTRGAAISLARIDTANERLTLAGVGNVDARLSHPNRDSRFSPNRGIVGVILPKIQPLELPLRPGWLLLVYSDGIQSRVTLPENCTPDHLPGDIAATLLERWARPTDDATVVVARCG